jgi:hypothetical protein
MDESFIFMLRVTTVMLLFVLLLHGNEMALFGVWSVKEDEVGRACGTGGGGKKCIQGFGGET